MSGTHLQLVCAHHWLLARPADGIVRGVCKKCGAARDYPAQIEDEPASHALESVNRDGRTAGRGRPVPVDRRLRLVI
jgi:hypothetical protein